MIWALICLSLSKLIVLALFVDQGAWKFAFLFLSVAGTIVALEFKRGILDVAK